MTTQVLMINPALSFAVSLKQALERTGIFTVHPFTTPDAAFEYLQNHPQDVALVDFSVPLMSGETIVRQLRAIQPDISVVVSPKQPEGISRALNLSASIDPPYTARDIIPLLNRAAGQRPLAQTRRMTRPLPDDEPPPQQRPFVETSATQVLEDVPTPPPVETEAIGEGPAPEEALPPTDDLPDWLKIHLEDRPRPGSPDTVVFDTPDDSGFEAPLLDIPDWNAAPSSPSVDNPAAEANDPFANLVNSLREESPPPERTQAFIDFVLPGVYEPKDKPASSPDDVPESGIFRRLTEEEPPLPSLADSGTVGDLISGAQDASFLNVLALLRGEEPPSEAAAAPLSDEELEAFYSSFYGEDDKDEDAVPTGVGDETVVHDPFRSFDADDDKPIPARLILETAFDESTPPEQFSLDALIRNIERQLPSHRPNVQPLPSWRKEGLSSLEPIVSEPDFLPEELPPVTMSESAAARMADQTTQPSSGRTTEAAIFETETWDDEFPATAPLTMPEMPEPGGEDTAQPPEDLSWLEDEGAEPVSDSGQTPAVPATSDLETAAEEIDLAEFEAEFDSDRVSVYPAEDALPPVPEIDNVPELATEWIPEEPPPLVTMDQTAGFDSALFDTEFERLAAFDFPDAVILEHRPEAAPAGDELLPDPEKERIAQLALSLTQVSLELTAEASLLTRGREIIAYAGEMSDADLAELREAVNDDWAAHPEQARVRFITLESSGKDIMLYSIRTVDDLTLSMVFAGTTSLRDIRRQGRRLSEALEAVPDRFDETAVAEAASPEAAPATTLPEPVEAAAVESGPLTAYSAVWVLRDPHMRLSEPAAKAIESGLRTQLNDRGWRVHSIQAQDEYVYMLADMPSERPAKEIISDLKRRSAAIVRAVEPGRNGADLWADGYLMVMPGRELDQEEIQQFIDFERT